MRTAFRKTLLLSSAVLILNQTLPAQAAWKPTHSVEFVVPGPRNGGADFVLRKVAEVMEKNGDLPAGYTVVNKGERQGAEAYVYMKEKKAGDEHTLMGAAAEMFLNPPTMGLTMGYKDFTPVARVATDQFIFWVHADSKVKTLGDFVRMVKEKPTRYQMGGAMASREDRVVTSRFQQATGTLLNYVATKGGADAARHLSDKSVDCTVNNPAELAEQYKLGKVRPLAIFSEKRLGF